MDSAKKKKDFDQKDILSYITGYTKVLPVSSDKV